MSPLSPRTQRILAPLVSLVWVLLAFEALGGLWIFFVRLAYDGRTPGLTLHWWAGWALTVLYVVYQWQHWSRVAPLRARLDYVMGLIAALSMVFTLGTGVVLGLPWWHAHMPAQFPFMPLWSGAHNVLSMLTLTFVGAHLGAVLFRDAQRRAASQQLPGGGPF